VLINANNDYICRLLFVLIIVQHAGYKSLESPLLFHWFVKEKRLRTIGLAYDSVKFRVTEVCTIFLFVMVSLC